MLAFNFSIFFSKCFLICCTIANIFTVSSLQTLPVLWTCHLSYTPQESCRESFGAQWMPTLQLFQSDGRKMATHSESRRSVMGRLLTSEMSRLLTTLQITDCPPMLLSQYPGWSQMADGSIRVAEVTEDSLGTYTCVPYNVLGTMGQSPPATLVLKVSQCISIKGVIMGGITFSLKVCVLNIIMWPQDPPYFNVRPGGEYRQEAGRELVIPCAASGDPEIPTIVWRKVPWPTRTLSNL